MKLLLDTHIWYWSIQEPRRLSRMVAKALRRPTTELFVSPLTNWELLVLSSKGRITLRPNAREFLADAWSLGAVREVPVTNEVVGSVGQIWLPHNDPVDMLLAATAKCHGFTLVTEDEKILRGRGFEVMENA